MSTFFVARSIRRSWRGFCVACGLVWLITGSVYSSDFEFLSTHPDAALQTTDEGKTLHTLHAVDGHLFVGYGDYSFDTGPISLRSFDPATSSFSDSLGQVSTEAIYRIQNAGSQVFALTTDPFVRDPGGYAAGMTGQSSSWSMNESLPFLHVFDFAASDPSTLFLSGSGGPDDIFHSVVYASQDGGSTWDLSLHANVPDGIEPGNGNFSRFYGVAELNGEMYVQQIFFRSGVAEPSSMFRFDGTNWNESPALTTADGDWTYFIDPDEFHGGIIARDAHPGMLSPIYQFDGSDLVKLAPEDSTDVQYWDQYVDGDSIYLLTSDQRVIRSDDMIEWDTVADDVPESFRSLAVVGNDLYFGATDSALHRFAMVPEATGPVSLLCLLTLWIRHTRKLAACC